MPSNLKRGTSESNLSVANAEGCGHADTTYIDDCKKRSSHEIGEEYVDSNTITVFPVEFPDDASLEGIEFILRLNLRNPFSPGNNYDMTNILDDPSVLESQQTPNINEHEVLEGTI